MVATYSTMQELGASAPAFSLPDVRANNAHVSLAGFSDRPVLLMFICNHCPFVIHLMTHLTEVANEFGSKGFGVVAISANDVETYPQDGPDLMLEFADEYNFDFAYCYDESQQVAKAYDAACTPDFFIYDHGHRLRYRGQFDSSRPGNDIPITGEDLVRAMQAVLNGERPSADQLPSVGCNIKWRDG